MKKNLQKILTSLKELNPVLQSNFGVKSIEIFGSYIRNEQNSKSDIDILVTFKETPGLLKFIELENFLSDKLNIKVDLVMKDSIKPRLRDSILNSAVSV